MFLYINPVKFKRRCKRVIYPEAVEIGDRYYYSMTLPIIKGVPQWQGLVTSERLLLPRSLSAPSGFKVYGGYDWQLTLAAEKLKRRLKTEKCDLIFIDSRGNRGGLLVRLAEYARSTAVLTNNPEYYLDVQDEIYGKLGCCIQINTTLGVEGGYAFIAHKDGVNKIKSGFKVVTVNSLREEDIEIPCGYMDCIPKDVSKCDFSEALYSAWGIGRLRDYITP